MIALIDSNVFIARFFKRDQYYEASNKILYERFAKDKINNIYTTDYVVIETVNFLLSRTVYQNAKEFLDYVFNTKEIKIIYMGQDHVYRLRKKFEKYKMSLTDCSLLLVAEDYEIKTLFSFDKGFDKVKEIERKI